MRPIAIFLLALAATAQTAPTPTNEEREVISTVQHLFDAMSTKDGAAIRSIFIPSASIVSSSASGKVTTSTGDSFATRVTESKETWLERMWTPKVMLQGNIAVLWAPYDFHRGGKLTHCGIDLINLAKTETGWKIVVVSFTVQTEGCPANP